jgi:hypothetical protein
MSSDPVVRSDSLDKKIAAIPTDHVFTKRKVTIAFVVLWFTSVVGFGFAAWRDDIRGEQIHDIAVETNDRVQQEIVELTARLDEYEVALGKAVDHILILSKMLSDVGIDPPELVLRIEPED